MEMFDVWIMATSTFDMFVVFVMFDVFELWIMDLDLW